MSLDLEVRSDDDYSRSVPRQRVTDVLVNQRQVVTSATDLLLYTRDGCYVEISLGTPETPTTEPDAVAWVGFRVPAGAALKSADRALRMAMAVAQEVGWRVFDPQRDDYIPPSELEPGPSFREALAQLGREVRLAGWRCFARKIGGRMRRQSLSGLALSIVLGFAAAVAAGWLFRFSVETRPMLSLILTAMAGAALVTLDVVTDVLGEIHQEAVRARAKAGE